MKEIPLKKITEIVATKKGILNKILTTWNVKFVWKDKDTVIWFPNIKRPDQVAMYVSRLKDFLKENPDFPPSELKPFIPRQERYQ